MLKLAEKVLKSFHSRLGDVVVVKKQSGENLVSLQPCTQIVGPGVTYRITTEIENSETEVIFSQHPAGEHFDVVAVEIAASQMQLPDQRFSIFPAPMEAQFIPQKVQCFHTYQIIGKHEFERRTTMTLEKRSKPAVDGGHVGATRMHPKIAEL